jgi:hypothetical protein
MELKKEIVFFEKKNHLFVLLMWKVDIGYSKQKKIKICAGL